MSVQMGINLRFEASLTFDFVNGWRLVLVETGCNHVMAYIVPTDFNVHEQAKYENNPDYTREKMIERGDYIPHIDDPAELLETINKVAARELEPTLAATVNFRK